MATSYDSLSGVCYRLFGECLAEHDFFSNIVWLYIRSNNYAFPFKPSDMAEVGELMRELRDIAVSIEMFEAGDMVFG